MAGGVAASMVFVNVGIVKVRPGAATEPVIETLPDKFVERDLAEEERTEGSVRSADVVPVLDG